MGAIIDFEDQTAQTTITDPVVVTADDGSSFTFTADTDSRLQLDGAPSSGPDSTLALFARDNGDSFSVAPTNGGTFDLLDLDLGNATFGARTTTVTATFADGSTQSLDFEVPGRSFVDAVTGFTGATSVAFLSDGNERVGVDNLNVVIPEPASLALLAAGGVLMLGRKRGA